MPALNPAEISAIDTAHIWHPYSTIGAPGTVAPIVAIVKDTFKIHAGTIDKAAFQKLPAIDGPVTIPTPEQTEKASKYLADNWAKAVG